MDLIDLIGFPEIFLDVPQYSSIFLGFLHLSHRFFRLGTPSELADRRLVFFS